MCGALKNKLSLSERTFICDECGYEIDRDLNASINLKNYGKSIA
ncbi:zinc ribbon domain-containing protein [Alkalithermobacter thermoalcaliphilus]